MVWDFGTVHLGFDHQTLGVHQQMPLPAADLLAAVEAPLLAAYPGALGLLCASTIPALGSGSLPSFSLNSRRIVRFNLSQVPSSLHALK